MRSRVQMLNLLLAPVVGSTGAEWKDHKVDGAKRKRTASSGGRDFVMGDQKDDAAKEAGLLNAFARSGLQVRAVKAAPASAPSGGTK